MPSDTPEKKKEITIKKNPKVDAIKRAPDELVAKAIHDALVKDHSFYEEKT